MEAKYIAQIPYLEPLDKVVVQGTLLNVYALEGDDLLRLHCDDGIVDETIYLHKKAIDFEELQNFIGKEILAEGVISLITRNKQKSIFCFDIKLKN